MTAQIVTVPDVDDSQCGALVYWALSGTTDADELTAHWVAAGLPVDQVPGTPTPDTALRRAVKERASKHTLMRRIDSGWALVNEKAVGDNLDYAVTLRIKVNKVGQISFEEGPAWEFDDRVKVQIEGAYMRHLDELSAQDVSAWLVKMVEQCSSVRLRETGGFYFVPRTTLPHWRAMSAAIRGATAHSLFEIPALTSEEAIDAVLASLKSEAEKAASDMEAELEAEELGERALRNRSEACERMAAKVAQYEQLLGVAQSDLQQRLEALKVNLATAALIAGDD